MCSLSCPWCWVRSSHCTRLELLRFQPCVSGPAVVDDPCVPGLTGALLLQAVGLHIGHLIRPLIPVLSLFPRMLSLPTSPRDHRPSLFQSPERSWRRIHTSPLTQQTSPADILLRSR
ncbi:hypothetical protein BJX63DRAFT_120822 [Aspergillus granulosus]|uniref:Uncharacterized protein n=1 Tax=Aspergillus granulosus TaxID=176169 RepID=A0ABR4GTG8_9EURO